MYSRIYLNKDFTEKIEENPECYPCFLTMAQQPIDYNEDDYGPQAATTQFVGAITGDHGSEKVVHDIEDFRFWNKFQPDQTQALGFITSMPAIGFRRALRNHQFYPGQKLLHHLHGNDKAT